LISRGAIKDTRAREEIRALVKEERGDLFRMFYERFRVSSCWHRYASRFCLTSTEKTTSKPNTIKKRRVTMPIG